MKANNREIPEIFGVSLMDTVSCGIGASILMMLLFVTMVEPSSEVNSSCSDCSEALISAESARPIFTLIVEVTDYESDVRWQPESRDGLSSELTYGKASRGNVSGLANVEREGKIVNHRLFAQLVNSHGDLVNNLVFNLTDSSGTYLELDSLPAYFVRENRADLCTLRFPRGSSQIRLNLLKNTYQLENCEVVR